MKVSVHRKLTFLVFEMPQGKDTNVNLEKRSVLLFPAAICSVWKSLWGSSVSPNVEWEK